MKRALMLALVLALSAGVADAASKCKDSKGKFIKCPPAATAVSSAPPTGHAPHCVKGVPCGNTCIAKGKVCHK